MKFKTYTAEEIDEFLADHGVDDISDACWKIIKTEPCNIKFDDAKGILTIKIKFEDTGE